MESDLAAEGIVDLFPQATTPPAVEVIAHRALGGEVMGQFVPLAAVGQEVEEGVEDLPQIGLPRRTGWHGGWQQRLEDGPLFVGQITGVGLA